MQTTPTAQVKKPEKKITLFIPVKSYVQKYLVKRYGSLYTVSKRDAIGIVLFQMLRRPSTEARATERIKTYTAKYPVVLSPKDFWKRGCRNLDDAMSIEWHKLVEDLIYQEYCGYIENLEAHGVEQRYAIEAFMAKYDFDETDIKFETIKKAYQRFRVEQTKLGILPIKVSDILPYLCALNMLGSRKKIKKVVKSAA
ncbi:hypothetical protein HUW51_17040 [Adhaeribacter swui]|uniref:Uncharacterized protein n=1 Tax=Adhaeribacter swui TaxID=2086471 RepID=A0A7G7GB10_9BACT|nr:hypothetical protein [Adhaeribacter swui]QNF34344.1 hypothetical protein HUW51_17040 [Adhaeribacter swui]